MHLHTQPTLAQQHPLLLALPAPHPPPNFSTTALTTLTATLSHAASATLLTHASLLTPHSLCSHFPHLTSPLTLTTLNSPSYSPPPPSPPFSLTFLSSNALTLRFSAICNREPAENSQPGSPHSQRIPAAEAVHWAKIGDHRHARRHARRCRRGIRAYPPPTHPGLVGPSLPARLRRHRAPLDAALVNATAAHALDFDDCSDSLGGHPSAPILPPLFALATRKRARGRAFLTAYVAGFETETRLARAVQFPPLRQRLASHFHARHLRRRRRRRPSPPPRRRTNRARAGPRRLVRLGIKANFGTMTKPLHVGHAARNGLLRRAPRPRGLHRQPGPSSTARASSRCSTAQGTTTPRACSRTGLRRSTSSAPASPSSNIRAAAAPIRRSIS